MPQQPYSDETICPIKIIILDELRHTIHLMVQTILRKPELKYLKSGMQKNISVGYLSDLTILYFHPNFENTPIQKFG